MYTPVSEDPDISELVKGQYRARIPNEISFKQVATKIINGDYIGLVNYEYLSDLWQIALNIRRFNASNEGVAQRVIALIGQVYPKLKGFTLDTPLEERTPCMNQIISHYLCSCSDEDFAALFQQDTDLAQVSFQEYFKVYKIALTAILEEKERLPEVTGFQVNEKEILTPRKDPNVYVETPDHYKKVENMTVDELRKLLRSLQLKK